jgi:hypothetical protein
MITKFTSLFIILLNLNFITNQPTIVNNDYYAEINANNIQFVEKNENDNIQIIINNQNYVGKLIFTLKHIILCHQLNINSNHQYFLTKNPIEITRKKENSYFLAINDSFSNKNIEFNCPFDEFEEESLLLNFIIKRDLEENTLIYPWCFGDNFFLIKACQISSSFRIIKI